MKFSTMHLIQLFLPAANNEGNSFSKELFNTVEEELTRRFGGVTSYIRAPAEGLWKDDKNNMIQDDIILIEVMVTKIDRIFWKSYKTTLQKLFKQSEIIIRVSPIQLL